MSNGSVEQSEPARQVLLDRQLLLELRLQLQLRRVVALLPLAARDARPPRAALVAVDPVRRVAAAPEREDGREQLRPEAARLQLRPDQVRRRHEVLEVV